MPKRRPENPSLTVNRDFMTALLDADPPVFALGLVEIGKRRCGFLAFRPAEPIPAESLLPGFSFGHGLRGRSPRECVIQFGFHFYGFGAYHALVNPNSPVVRTVLETMVKTQDYWFFLLGVDQRIETFRSELEEDNLAGLKTNLPLIRAATTTEDYYRRPWRRPASRSGEGGGAWCASGCGWPDVRGQQGGTAVTNRGRLPIPLARRPRI